MSRYKITQVNVKQMFVGGWLHSLGFKLGFSYSYVSSTLPQQQNLKWGLTVLTCS